MPCRPDISPWDMPGITMLCVAALTQYWVRGFFGSAADAGYAEQAIIATATIQDILVRRFMVISSLRNLFLSSALH